MLSSYHLIRPMPNLLTCVSEASTAESCCDVPYVWLNPDCVRACLIRHITPAAITPYVGIVQTGIMFGIRETEKPAGQKLQDLHFLINLLDQLFRERIRDTVLSGTDKGNAYYWESYKLSCIMKYFRCKLAFDTRGMYLDAGVYDPEHPPTDEVIATFPVPYEVACGDPAPPIQPVPPFYPPPPVTDCSACVNAISVVDVSDQDGYTNTGGERYLLAFNGIDVDPSFNDWAAHQNMIAIGDGNDGWTYETVVEGCKVHLTDPGYAALEPWIMSSGVVYLFYPVLSAGIDLTTLTLTTTYLPNGHSITSRDIVIEVAADDLMYGIAYQGPENVLGDTYDVTVPANTTHVRITYLGDCPSIVTDITTIVVPHPPRSIRMAGSTISSSITSIEGSGAPIPNMVVIPKFFCSVWIKWNGSGWTGTNRELNLFNAGSSADPYRWSFYIIRTAGSGEMTLHCDVRDWMAPFDYIYAIGMEMPAVTTAMDGSWHLLTISKDGPTYNFDLGVWSAWIDLSPVTFGGTNQIGTDADYNHGLVPLTHTRGVDFLINRGNGSQANPIQLKNAVWGTRAVALADITNILYPGDILAHMVDLQVVQWMNGNEPDMIQVSPFLGSQAIPLLSGFTSNSAFVADVPAQLIFP